MIILKGEYNLWIEIISKDLRLLKPDSFTDFFQNFSYFLGMKVSELFKKAIMEFLEKNYKEDDDNSERRI